MFTADLNKISRKRENTKMNFCLKIYFYKSKKQDLQTFLSLSDKTS